MTKYDFKTDLGLNTSTGIILSKIPSGSTVLEFGCAAGRMTKYMKNALDCQVYIVEYDKEAFETAIQYAVDGVCDDILTLSWLDRFKEIKFDIILFADVLEHLPQPDLALSNAAKLLEENGKIYISIPNIAHNDVLLKAFHNHFDYTDIGLLDNTHVHFWGFENIVPFAEKNGLFVHNIETTYLPTGQSEQFTHDPILCPPVLFNYFKERQFAEAYQFVIELGRKNEEQFDEKELKISYKKNTITSHLYIDDGSGFNAENVVSFESENTTPGRYVVHYVFDKVENVKKLRFDPVEYQGCIIQNLSVRQAGRELEYGYSDYLKFSEGFLILGTDPMVFVELPDDSGTVVIDADIIIYGEEYLELVQKACADKYSEIQSLSQKIGILSEENGNLHREREQLTVENASLKRELENLSAGNVSLQRELESISAQNKKLHGEIEGISADNRSFQAEIGGYILLANEKDRLLLEKDSDITELKEQVDYYKNRKCIRILDRFWKIYWAIRLRFRRLIRKRTKDA